VRAFEAVAVVLLVEELELGVGIQERQAASDVDARHGLDDAGRVAAEVGEELVENVRRQYRGDRALGRHVHSPEALPHELEREGHHTAASKSSTSSSSSKVARGTRSATATWERASEQTTTQRREEEEEEERRKRRKTRFLEEPGHVQQTSLSPSAPKIP